MTGKLTILKTAATWIGHTVVVLLSIILLYAFVNFFIGTYTPAEVEKAVISKAPEYLSSVNAERIKIGATLLTIDPTLNNTAKLKADDMVKHGYYDHDRPDGSAKWTDIFDKNRPGDAAIGENLDRCALTKDQDMKAWIASPGHYKNIMDTRWKYFGSYSEIDPRDGCMIVVNHFST